MTRGLPSMTALLGLLALAGYQSRDKLAEMLKGVTAGGASQQTGQGGQGGLGSLLGGLSGNIRPGGVLGGGLGAAVQAFRQSGHADAADSWVAPGPNKPIQP